MDDQELLDLADAIAVEAHRGQTDQAGVAYISHPRRVAGRVRDAGGDTHQIAVALLHDVLEDSALTADDLRGRGIPEPVIGGVEAMTKPAGADYEQAVAIAARHPLAHLVKRCDIGDNTDPARLARLDDELRRRLEGRYARGLAVLDEVDAVR